MSSSSTPSSAATCRVIQATVLVTVLLALFVQLAVDLIYPLIDPRVRLGEAAR